jgi:hypothetical protein
MPRCACALLDGTIKWSASYANDNGVVILIIYSQFKQSQDESEIYGDVLVFDYIDDYHHLSVKSWLTSEYHTQRFSGKLWKSDFLKKVQILWQKSRKIILQIRLQTPSGGGRVGKRRCIHIYAQPAHVHRHPTSVWTHKRNTRSLPMQQCHRLPDRHIVSIFFAGI